MRVYHRDRETGELTGGSTAHVHKYASSVIVNELRAPGTCVDDCQLIVTEDGPEPRISFKYVTGKKKGRERIFTPSGDDTGWDEMVKFAQALQTILRAGYNVS
ncbi:hypothetical protein EOL96_03365 [Candidatus Saccharibacteria bacterium]|nr:hypothetical protein [Candidatus Saccharibacteria bacterium]